MSDSSVPLSITELEEVVQQVAHSLYARWAEGARFTEEQMTEYAQFAVEDSVFVINEYMAAVNSVMSEKARTASLLGTSPQLVIPDI